MQQQGSLSETFTGLVRGLLQWQQQSETNLWSGECQPQHSILLVIVLVLTLPANLPPVSILPMAVKLVRLQPLTQHQIVRDLSVPTIYLMASILTYQMDT